MIHVLAEAERNIKNVVERMFKICYNNDMRNWSTDTEKLKRNKEKFAIWKLEQMVNFGLGGERIKKSELKKYWKVLNIDPAKRKFLSLILK
jgi:hypothetical protein